MVVSTTTKIVRSAMPRRETQTKAKAFAFVMDQLAWIGDDLLVDANGGRPLGGSRPSKLAFWSWLFPEIGNDAAKRSRLQAGKRPEELLQIVGRPDGKGMEGMANAKLSLDVLASFDLACVLGWRMRCEDGPFEELFSSDAHFAKRFDGEAIDTFLRLLNDDFAGCQPYSFEGLQDAITAVRLGISRAEEGCVCSWRMDFERYGGYLVRKHRVGGKKQDWRADLATLLLMSALLGPKDWRADLLIDTPEKYESTADYDSQFAVSADKVRSGGVARKLDVRSRFFLTRVTFDCDPPDEMDWFICEGDIGGVNSGRGQLLAIPLDGKTRVVMARGLPRFSDVGESVEVPLNCRDASSKAHLALALEGGEWLARDLGSTNGTLVVSRDGMRRMLWRKEAGGDQAVILRNGDVICIAPNHHTGHAVPTNPAFLFHAVTNTWF